VTPELALPLEVRSGLLGAGPHRLFLGGAAVGAIEEVEEGLVAEYLGNAFRFARTCDAHSLSLRSAQGDSVLLWEGGFLAPSRVETPSARWRVRSGIVSLRLTPEPRGAAGPRGASEGGPAGGSGAHWGSGGGPWGRGGKFWGMSGELMGMTGAPTVRPEDTLRVRLRGLLFPRYLLEPVQPVPLEVALAAWLAARKLRKTLVGTIVPLLLAAGVKLLRFLPG